MADLKIADLVKDYTLPQWQEFPDLPGFRVLVRLPDAPQGFALAARAFKAANPEDQHSDAPPPEMARYLARYAVAGWEGLTVRGLKTLVAQNVAGDDDRTIPFDQDNLEALLSLSGTFFYWLLGEVQTRQRAAQQEAAETENLSATSSTTPTPTP